MFAKFYEIPSLPFQDIEKQKRRGEDKQMHGQMDNVKTVYPPTDTVCGGGGIKMPASFLNN